MREKVGDWATAVDAVASAESVAIACHINPDGDALGALFASALGLEGLGKKTHASWGAASVRVPPQYAFLPGADRLVQPQEVPKTEVFLALDCGSIDRLGELEGHARAAHRLINVDHHAGNGHFGTLNIVVESASSTSELMMGILRDLGVEFDRDIATCLYTGIVTDTGRFSYENSSPETLRVAADLLSYGVPHPRIAQEVFESLAFDLLKLIGRMLERATLFETERFVYSCIRLQDLEEAGVRLDETEKLVDVLREVREAEVAVLFKEQKDRTYRVSLRSRGPSVGAIARAHGGGGHELAAGFTAEDVGSAVEAIRTALR